MNTVQSNQEKRSIKVKDFLDDFRSGALDAEMIKKYHLTPVGLEKFYNMLVDRGIVSRKELQEHYKMESLQEKDLSSETSSFICPCCLASHEEMFDICPSCGVSFQELISRETRPSSLEESKASTTDIHSLKNEKASKRDEVSSLTRDEYSVSVPPAIIEPAGPAESVKMEKEDGYFMNADDMSKTSTGFDDSLDEIGDALDSMEHDKFEEQDAILCDSCDSPMQPGLRDIYDQTRGRQSLMLAGVCFVLGFLGTLALGFFDGFSFVRLIAVYATGLLFLFGAVFLGVGAFMYMAREKVFFCPSCTRIYPRV